MSEIDPIKLKRLKNLRMFRDKTDEEIIEYLNNRPVKRELPTGPKEDKTYEAKFRKLFQTYQDEYGIDMNDSNDYESLVNLVRHSLQLERVNDQIIQMQSGDVDTRVLKNLGDYQRSLVTSISEFQDKLGITRKTRKEKQLDDVPQFIESLKNKALDFWQRKTVAINCSTCEIELARFWLNFPELSNVINLNLECWKCGEKIIYGA